MEKNGLFGKIQRTRNDFFYCQLATNYILNHRVLLKEFQETKSFSNIEGLSVELEGYDKEISEAEFRQLSEKYGFSAFTLDLFKMQSFAYIVVIFSALCLEALINDYCTIKTSSSYFKDHIDKLSIVNKWVIGIKLVTGKEFPKDAKAFGMLVKLFRLRDKMVHPKSQKFDQGTWKRNAVDLFTKRAFESYLTIGEVTHALFEIDPQFDYLKEYSFFWDKGKPMRDFSDVVSFFNRNWGS